MGRPRGSGKNTAMLNGRVTGEQMEWLVRLADQKYGGNLSAALREALTWAELLEAARRDYLRLREEHPEFAIPRNDDDNTTRVVEFALSPIASVDGRLDDEEDA
jgi:hypothetical protein